MDKEETPTYENILYVIKKFQKQGFEGLKLEDLAIAVSLSDFRINFLKNTGIDWTQKYELKALEKLRKCNFDMKWMQSELQEEFTPLFNYIKKGDLQKTKDFILQHKDLQLLRNAQDSHNRSPLHVASKLGHTVIVEYLLLQGFSVHCRDKQLQTPLHLAAYHAQEYICEQLIKKGATLDAVDIKGRNPFHYACCSSSSRTVVMFIGLNPEIIESQDNDSLTGLHYGVLNSSGKQVEIVRALLEYGAKVNARDKDGKTPLYYASEAGKSRVIPLLLQRGGDVELTNYQNHKNSLDVAANERTRELLIVYSNVKNTTSLKKDDVEWMDNAIKGQTLIKEVPFKENNQQTVKKNTSQTSKKLQQQQGTIQGWVREKFFKIMKNVQEEGIKVNQHLKKPFIYTGSWMENAQNVEDLYNIITNFSSTEATLCVFNILCPSEIELPQEPNKEVIDNFYGDAWTSSLKVPLELKAKKEVEYQEKMAQMEDLQQRFEINQNLLKEKIEELKRLREDNMQMTTKLEEYKGMQLNQLNIQQIQDYQKENDKLKLELRNKSKQLMERDMEIELLKLEGKKDDKPLLSQEKTKRELQLEEELKIQKLENQMQRFKAGQIFLKSLSGLPQQNKQKQNQEELNLFDDDAIIALYKALKENPNPKFIQRLKDVDKDNDGYITQPEFVKFCNTLSLSNQDIVSLQRIVGFLDGKQTLGISEFKEILENRPKQRQLQEEILFKKIIKAFNQENLAIEEVFIQLDVDNSGDISPQELKEGLQKMHVDLVQSDFNCLFNIFDKDRNGKISLQEMKDTIQNYIDKFEKSEESIQQQQQLWMVENERYLQEEINDEEYLKGFIKIQIPAVRGARIQNNVYLKITLKGSQENIIIKQGIASNALLKVALKFSFDEKSQLSEVNDFVNIQLFQSEKISEQSFLGEVFVAWKCSTNEKNEWKINQEFTLVNNEFPNKKISEGFLTVQLGYFQGLDLKQQQQQQQDGQIDDVYKEFIKQQIIEYMKMLNKNTNIKDLEEMEKANQLSSNIDNLLSFDDRKQDIANIDSEVMFTQNSILVDSNQKNQKRKVSKQIDNLMKSMNSEIDGLLDESDLKKDVQSLNSNISQL